MNQIAPNITTVEAGDDATQNGVQRFFDDANRRYERQRRLIVEAESAHAIARAKLLDGFRVKLGELQHEAREAVAKLDAQYRESQDRRDRVLTALDNLRQG